MKAKNYSKRSRGSGMQVLLTFVLISSTFFLNLHSSAQPSVTPTVVNVFCAGDMTGSVTLQVTGAGPFTFLWNNGVTVQNLVHKFAGTYTVTVTDANNAKDSVSQVISEPLPLAINGIITPVTCRNLSTGAIDITVTGGTKTADYVYSWSTLDGSGVTPLNQDQIGLTDGTYSLVVKDDHLCTLDTNFVVTEPDKISFAGSTVTSFTFPPGSLLRRWRKDLDERGEDARGLAHPWNDRLRLLESCQRCVYRCDPCSDHG